MSDGSKSTDFMTPGTWTGTSLKLGYLVCGGSARPFSLLLRDLCPLIVVGERARDIYYSLLLQLVDEHHLPLVILKGSDPQFYEEQLCESRLWLLDAGNDHITFNLLDLGQGQHPAHQVRLLVRLLADLYQLSPAAQNLLHVAVWQTLLTHPKPSLQALLSLLPRYRYHTTAYEELCQSLSQLPQELAKGTHDNVCLARLRRYSTIITLPPTLQGCLTLNLLLLKLLAFNGSDAPPLMILDPPYLNHHLFSSLLGHYTAAGTPLILFDSNNSLLSSFPLLSPPNLIFTNSCGSSHSHLSCFLTEEEVKQLQADRDRVAVKLSRDPSTYFVTIF